MIISKDAALAKPTPRSPVLEEDRMSLIMNAQGGVLFLEFIIMEGI